MKNYRKILSIILTICMVMQILPVFADNTESNTQPQIVYLLNEQYGDKDTGTWRLGGNTTNATLSTEPVQGDEGNYALTYTSTPEGDAVLIASKALLPTADPNRK